jgi:hypothetical protein
MLSVLLSEIMATKPLRWCLDWNNPSPKDRFLMGCPFVGTEDRAYKDIVCQLKERTEADLAVWDAYPPEVRQLALGVASALKDQRIWPSRVFLPTDPADIPFHLRETDRWDLLPAAFGILEKDFGIKMESEFWDNLPGMTYGQAIEELVAKKAEPSGLSQ